MVDAKHVLSDTHKIMEIGVRLLHGSWLFNGKGGGGSIFRTGGWFFVSGLPSFMNSNPAEPIRSRPAITLVEDFHW